MTNYVLVDDVGGTNTRLALCDVDTGEISHIYTCSGDDYDTLEGVIHHYLTGQKVAVKEACIAIACTNYRRLG